MADLLGYMRVSTQGQDLDAQRRRLKEAGVIKIFEDVISGRTFERPGLSALLNYARPNDVLVVVRLDRLGRSLRELLETVEMLKQNHIGFMSLEEKIDTASAAGELIFHVFGAIAHFERRLIAERTKDGIEAARARGKRPGRPPLNLEKREAAFTLIESGISPTKVAEQLGIGRSTLYRELNLRPGAPKA
jgi:DNA invertase Pin-like site-specific DNA recombinase